MIQPRVVGQKRLPHGAVLGKVPSSQPGGAQPAPRHGAEVGKGFLLRGMQVPWLACNTNSCIVKPGLVPRRWLLPKLLGWARAPVKKKKQDPLVGDAATDAPPQRLARRGGEGLENHEGLGFAPSAALPGGERRQSLAVRCRRAPPWLPFGF